MTIKELIEKLRKYPETHEVMILDSFNGGGFPRTINCGPLLDTIRVKDALKCSDCEGRIGEPVVVMGFGWYLRPAGVPGLEPGPLASEAKSHTGKDAKS